MTTDDMFPEARSLSPRLAWLQNEKLCTFKTAAEWVGMEVPETGDIVPRWVCRKETGLQHSNHFGGGDTEDEAIFDYCAKAGTNHWSLNTDELKAIARTMKT